MGYYVCYQASLEAQPVKSLPAMQETQVWSLGWEDTLQRRIATHSSILAWRIPWTEEPGCLQSMGLQRVRHNWVTKQQQWLMMLNIFPWVLFPLSYIPLGEEFVWILWSIFNICLFLFSSDGYIHTYTLDTSPVSDMIFKYFLLACSRSSNLLNSASQIKKRHKQWSV